MAEQANTEAAPLDLEKVARRYRSVGSAVKANDVEAVRLLGQHMKESINDEMLNLLLWRGAAVVTPEMAAVLVELGANPRMLHYEGLDQISSGVQAARHGNAALLEWFITQGHFTVDDTDGSGNGFLAIALMGGHLEAANRLKTLGVDLDARNFHDETAFHLAAGTYQVQSMVWLVENGADPTLLADDGCDVAQCVPLQVEGHAGSEWNPDAMSRFIDEYAQAFKASRDLGSPVASLAIPADVQAEIDLERGPESVPEISAVPTPVEVADKDVSTENAPSPPSGRLKM